MENISGPNNSPIEKDKEISADSPLRKLINIFRTNSALKFHAQSGNGVKPMGTAKAFFRNGYNLQSHVGAMSVYDRFARYSDYMEMESNPIISKALDTYADEATQKDEEGNIIKVISDDHDIKAIIEELLGDILHLNGKEGYKLIRYLCKYGDVFYLIDATEDHGVVNLILVPANEVEREEGFDKNEPTAVRFRWATRSNMEIPNAYMAHFRLDGMDQFMPFGMSCLEAARRPFRQITLMEDHMLAYRIIRTPERRVYYLDMMGIPPENEEEVVNKFNQILKKNPVVDANGNIDLRFGAAQTVEEDIVVPVRGGESGTRIETLPGGQNTTEINDVEYIRKNLFAALGIPKAFLTFDEGSGGKATLSMEDVRFARSIARIQESVINELLKICLIHLYIKGKRGQQLFDFKLKMTNPSTIAELQKNELWRARMDLVQSAGDGVFDTNFIYKNFLHLSDEAIDLIRKGQIQDKIFQAKLLAIESQGGMGQQGGMMGMDGGMGMGGGMGAFGGGMGGGMGGGGLGSSMGALGGADPNMGGGGMPAMESLNPAATNFGDGGGKDLTRRSANERVLTKRGLEPNEAITAEDVADSGLDSVGHDQVRRDISSPFGTNESKKPIVTKASLDESLSDFMKLSKITPMNLLEQLHCVVQPTIISARRCTSIKESFLMETFGADAGLGPAGEKKVMSAKNIIKESQQLNESEDPMDRIHESWNKKVLEIDVDMEEIEKNG